ncbi:MAG: hypothetical protein ACRD1U_00075 [Vicinamibacterales bacterium]
MATRNFIGSAVLVLASIGLTATEGRQLWYAPSCRHHDGARQADRARRAGALALAKAINAAQADRVQRTGTYQPVERLGTLPPVPKGFDLSLFADRTGYLFAIKDTQDPCSFAVFSDERGLLYEKSALDAPAVAE